MNRHAFYIDDNDKALDFDDTKFICISRIFNG